MEDYKELVEYLDEKFNKVESEIKNFKGEFLEFKENTLNFQDKALKDLEDLKQEKTMADAQDKRKTKVLKIHNDALKNSKALSKQQISEIDALQAF